MYGTLPQGRGVSQTSAWVGLPGGLGEALIWGAHSHAYTAMADSWVPALIVRVAARPRRGSRSLAGCTPRRDFSDAAGAARTIVGFCFEVFEPGEHDG